ncbi:MAG: nuclear transport factor 2 family protein [Myxococcota bacterium]|jgi:hypothetical protein|nr:hypothetical protein [Myxococcales bacterium]MEC7751055.1 nuclear transport factor 2 family protein [Myxococcota bacterium]
MKRQILWATLALTTACYGTMERHPGVKANPLNKEVVAVLDAYQLAMTSKNATALGDLVAVDFMEDMGTPDPSDDFGGRDEVVRRAQDRFSKIDELHMNLQLKEVHSDKDTVRARYAVQMRFRYKMPAGEGWERLDDVEELVLVRRDGKLRILSGL